MKKLLLFFILINVLFAWDVKGTEKYLLQKTISGIKIIYNTNGDIIYLGDILDDLKSMMNKYKDVKEVKFDGYPLDLAKMRYFLLHDSRFTKINSYNSALRILEYAIYVTAYNFEKAKDKALFEKQYNILVKDFRTLLKMSRGVAKYKDDLYYPTYFSFSQYKQYIVGPELYNFIYGYKIKERRKY